jgi:hypothetical protein
LERGEERRVDMLRKGQCINTAAKPTFKWQLYKYWQIFWRMEGRWILAGKG